MQLTNEFSVDAPLDVAWSALTDIPRVIACVPGAELEAQRGDEYEAKVAIKVGPVGMTLAGAATMVRRDDDAHVMVVRGNARDRKGNGSAEATVTLAAREDSGTCHVTVTTDLELGGRIAQFGSGVISQVSNRIIKQFVERLNAQISGPRAEKSEESAVAASAATARTGVVGSLQVVELALTALAGVALGLALGRLAHRLAPASAT